MALPQPSVTGRARPLDFLVIGATKCGTTSLHHYLRTHPGLFLPLVKEYPFFIWEKRFKLDWAAFHAAFFAGARADQLIGKVFPRYLDDHRVPARIRAHSPRIRLIAVLRNPIDRSYSHYRMVSRKGQGLLPFPQVVERLVRRAEAEHARHLVDTQPRTSTTLPHTYLAIGEYARLLDRYYRLFQPDDVLVLFAEELESARIQSMQRVFGFLGVDPSWIPPNIEKRYHEGGDRSYSSPVAYVRHKVLSKLTPLRFLWRKIPFGYQQAMTQFLETELLTRKSKPEPLPVPTRRALRDFFEPDVRALERLLGRPVPWSDFVATTRAGP